MKNITIYDIAREAEVSPATVSRILTGVTSVNEQKRKKVQEIIDKYDFKPNAMARGLTTSSTGLIGLLMPDAENPFYNSMFAHLCNEAYARGYSMMLFNTFSDPDRERDALTKLREQRVDAMILCGGRVDLMKTDSEYVQTLQKCAKACRVVIASISPSPEMAGVCIDHRQCMELALEHLFSLGHRKIGFLYAGMEFIGTDLKMREMQKRIREKGFAFREDWLIHADNYRMEGGRRAAEQFLMLKDRPSAMINLNDVLSVGFLQGVAAQGVKVPEELSLVAFDNSSIAEVPTPGITSIGYDYNAFASSLIDCAVGDLAKTPGVNLHIPGTICVRQSTGLAPMQADPKDNAKGTS